VADDEHVVAAARIEESDDEEGFEESRETAPDTGATVGDDLASGEEE
jgi:DNA gyrase subunit A